MRSADGRFEYRDQGDDPVPPGTPPSNIHRFAFVCRRSGLARAHIAPDQLPSHSFCSVNLRGRGHDVEKRSWAWDGNIEQPTLSPSINCADCWHGYIEAGVYVNTDKTPERQQ
jgi:hypothetical protein